jgi:hypothetical protein
MNIRKYEVTTVLKAANGSPTKITVEARWFDTTGEGGLIFYRTVDSTEPCAAFASDFWLGVVALADDELTS